MNKIATPIPSRRFADLLFLGFDSEFEVRRVFELTSRKSFHFHEFENSFAAFHWVHEQATSNSGHLPLAFFCNYKKQEEENFLFVRNLKNSAKLHRIPVILLAESSDDLIDKKTAIQLGIDDIFVAPFDWKKIENRITFLIDIKSLPGKTSKSEDSIKPFKIHFWKRTFDIAISSLLLLMLSPILLLISLAIKLESRGSIIYKSKRVGTGYQIFHFLKFRSMYADADKRLKELEHLNTYKSGDSKGPAFLKLENDPRITRVGKFIRKTSLDELPQLINVLRGEMSIVGNRPLPLYEAEQLTRDVWARRFLAPAGITGLWQVSPEGKENLSAEERIGLDIKYAQNYSPCLDLTILLKTLPAMLQKGE